jgi:hypothetical protein
LTRISSELRANAIREAITVANSAYESLRRLHEKTLADWQIDRQRADELEETLSRAHKVFEADCNGLGKTITDLTDRLGAALDAAAKAREFLCVFGLDQGDHITDSTRNAARGVANSLEALVTDANALTLKEYRARKATGTQAP